MSTTDESHDHLAGESLEEARARRSQWPVRKGKMSELERDDADLSASSTVAERFAWMWQMSQNAWAFRGEPIVESTLPRYLGRVIRRRS